MCVGERGRLGLHKGGAGDCFLGGVVIAACGDRGAAADCAERSDDRDDDDELAGDDAAQLAPPAPFTLWSLPI